MSWQSALVNTGLRIVKRQLSKKDFAGAQVFFDKMNTAASKATVPSGYVLEGTTIADVSCVWITPEITEPSRSVVMYFHGGAFMSGSPQTHLDPAWRLAESSGARILIVDYKLAPAAIFPSQLNDAVAVYRALLSDGYQSQQIAFAGDSAGGNMTLTVMLLLQQKQLPLPAAGVCFSPWFDLTHSGDSIVVNARSDPMLPVNVLVNAAAVYAQETNPENPLVSPVFADLSGFPPLLIYVGSSEILLDDAIRVAELARTAGVEVVYQSWYKQPHAFVGIAKFIPEGRKALQQAGEFLSTRLNP